MMRAHGSTPSGEYALGLYDECATLLQDALDRGVADGDAVLGTVSRVEQILQAIEPLTTRITASTDRVRVLGAARQVQQLHDALTEQIRLEQNRLGAELDGLTRANAANAGYQTTRRYSGPVQLDVAG